MEYIEKIKAHILRPHVLFFIVVMVTGMFFAVLNPFFQEMDADMHFYRSCDVSYGNVLAPFAVISHDSSFEEVPADIQNYPTWVLTPDQNEGREQQHKMKKLFAGWDTTEYGDPRSYASLYYYPQALGLVIARIFHMSAYSSVIWGHMMNLIAYALITALAVKIMPIYKATFAAAAMLPMSVYLAASFSADALLNAFCFLLIALIFHYAYDEFSGPLGIKQMLPLGILLWLIYLNKYVYIVLGILVFLIPREKFGSKKNYWKTFGIALIPLVVYIIYQIASGAFVPQYNLLDVLGTTKEEAGTASTLYPGMTQIEFVKEHPFEFIKVILRTMYIGIGEWMRSASTLGWMNAGLEPVTYWMPVIMVVIIFFDNPRTSGGKLAGTGLTERIIMGASVIILIVAVISSIYIFDEASNIVGWPVIRGIQGRYFLVCVPLLGMTLSPRGLESFSKHHYEKTLICMAAVLGFSVLIFYNHYYGYGILNF